MRARLVVGIFYDPLWSRQNFPKRSGSGGQSYPHVRLVRTDNPSLFLLKIIFYLEHLKMKFNKKLKLFIFNKKKKFLMQL
jgi:hypothetical protein